MARPRAARPTGGWSSSWNSSPTTKGAPELGVAKERFQFKGFSSSVPLEPNGTPQGREANRRVVFKLELITDNKGGARARRSEGALPVQGIQLLCAARTQWHAPGPRGQPEGGLQAGTHHRQQRGRPSSA